MAIGFQPTIIADRRLHVLHFEDGSPMMWDAVEGLTEITGLPKPDYTRPEHRLTATAVVRGRVKVAGVSRGSLLRFSGDDDGTVYYTRPGSSDRTVFGRHRGRVTVVTASLLMDRPVLYTGEVGAVGIWDLETLQLMDMIRVPGEVRELKADPDGYVLVDTGTEVIAFAHSSTAASQD
jgi:hypothetical protein